VDFGEELHQLLALRLVLLDAAERDEAVDSAVAESRHCRLDLEAGVDNRLGERLRLPAQLPFEVVAEPVPVREMPAKTHA
jgi:hypothetical protein